MVISGHHELRKRIAGETMQAIPAVVELVCSRLGIRLSNLRDRGAGLLAYPDPVTGLLITRQLEHQAGQWARNYMRDLREEGGSWKQIGEVIGWEDNAAAHAFMAATASPWLDSEAGQWRDDKTFGWRCPVCGKQVVDYGPEADAEHGHVPDCPRRATNIRAGHQ
jgi:hypothetical protein